MIPRICIDTSLDIAESQRRNASCLYSWMKVISFAADGHVIMVFKEL